MATIEADLFTWQPDRRYDAVFFGFWISHVPNEYFEPFWSMVADALEPDGTVFFFDDNYRTEAELIEGDASPIVERQLNDGSPFRVIKVPHQPAELESRLRQLAWPAQVGDWPWSRGKHRCCPFRSKSSSGLAGSTAGARGSSDGW